MAVAVGLVGLSLVATGCKAESPGNGPPEEEQIKHEQVIERGEVEQQEINQIYNQRIEQIAESAEKTEEEVVEEIFSLVQVGHRELGEWNDKENYSEIQVRPGYETYRIEGENIQELTNRIAFEVTRRFKGHIEEGSSFSIASRLTGAHIEGHFSNFVTEDRGVAEGLFERVQEEVESEGVEESENQEEDSGDVLQPPL